MKHKLSKRIIAMTLAVIMLMGTGIFAALVNDDWAELFSTTVSAEDAQNVILYDETKGLFFTVDTAARIVGTNRDALKASSDFTEDSNGTGTYTLPNKVTDSNTGIEYFVFSVNIFALWNSREDIRKLVIPDYFRELSLPHGAFAGMPNLTEIEFNASNAKITGPLFELVCEWAFNPILPNYYHMTHNLYVTTTNETVDPETGDIIINEIKTPIYNDRYGEEKTPNWFPYRDEYGELKTDYESSATVQFYETDAPNGITSGHTELSLFYDDNNDKLTNINTISRKDLDGYVFSAEIGEKNVTAEIRKDDGGTEFTECDVHIDIQKVDDLHNTNVNETHIVDGNGDLIKSNNIILYKSPVASIVLGENITSVPNYLFYDTNIKNVNLKNITSIGNYAFVDCDGLTSLDFSEVDSVCSYAFAACDGLTEVTIPEDMTSLGVGSFTLCDNLSTVYFNAVACECGFDAYTRLTDKDPNGCSPFTDTIVTTIIFGNKVTNIPSNIANVVPTLSTVYFLADEYENVESSAFHKSDSISEIILKNPDNLDKILGLASASGDNESLLFKDIAVTEHVHAYITTVIEPTCAAEGYTAEICICGEEKDKRDVVAKKPHTFKDEPTSSTEATCDEGGYDLYVCTVCGEAVKKNETAALGHNIENPTIIAPTCTEQGYTKGNCSRCGKEVKTDYTDKTPHNYKTTVISPTCTEGGYTLKVCNACGNSIKSDFKEPLGHDYGEYVYNNDATGTKDGTETATCSRCGDKTTRTKNGTRITVESGSGGTVSVGYRNPVQATASTVNMPEGAKIVWFIDGVYSGEGETFTVKSPSKTFRINSAIVDKNGNVISTSSKTTVEVNHGFLDILLWFFRLILGMIKTVYI